MAINSVLIVIIIGMTKGYALFIFIVIISDIVNNLSIYNLLVKSKI